MWQNLKLNVPDPCSENWEAMESLERGRFCLRCETQIFDFTSWSDKEIVELYKTKKGKMCGMIRADQLNRDLQLPSYAFAPDLKAVALGMAILASTYPALAAQEHHENQVSLVEMLQPTEVGTTVRDTIFRQSNFRFIVRDSQTGESVMLVKIVALDTNGNIVQGAISDYDGYAEMHLNDSDISKIDQLLVRSIDHDTLFVSWNNVILDPSVHNLGMELLLSSNEINQIIMLGIIEPVHAGKSRRHARRYARKLKREARGED